MENHLLKNYIRFFVCSIRHIHDFSFNFVLIETTFSVLYINFPTYKNQNQNTYLYFSSKYVFYPNEKPIEDTYLLLESWKYGIITSIYYIISDDVCV